MKNSSVSSFFQNITEKQIMVHSLVFVVKPTDTGIEVYFNNERLCKMERQWLIFDMAENGLQKWLSKMWDSHCKFPYYHSGNLPLLKAIGAFIEPSERQRLGFEPIHWKVIDRECVNTDLNSNGGDYSFFRIFVPLEEGYSVTYGSSTDLPYCRICGQWHETYKCDYMPQKIERLPDMAYPVYG